MNKQYSYFVIIPLFIFSCILSLNGQTSNTKKYFITFKDKDDSPYSLANPQEYLSGRSIARRKRQHIPIGVSDLPVNPSYLVALGSFSSKILHTSKWLNGATVLLEENHLEKIKRLKFVESIKYVGKPYQRKLLLRSSGKAKNSEPPNKKEESYYGFSDYQISQINLKELHKNNYKGQGMLIAVLDGGFTNTDIMPFFEKLHKEKRLFTSYDFVEQDNYVFETSAHGSQVLSVMAADLPNVMIGSAPDASYICLKTENNMGEYLSEECNWVAALEYADSVGVDIVNSSLGYTTFTDNEMSYSYEHLDGKTSLASQAADIAFSKGMIIVNSVGNEGNTDWKYLDVPADARYVLAVGATDVTGYKTKFSSYGPTADGRIKPDICALGKDIAVASVYNATVRAARGTSFSSPLIAGAIASLWQAVPYRTNLEILNAVKQSAHRSHRPDNQVGYGIPDFAKALDLLR